MFRPSFLVVLFLFSGFSASFAQVQTSVTGRPRRIQNPPLVSDASAPSAETIAEAKRLYKVGVKYGHTGLFRQAVETFQNVLKLDPSYADAYLSLGHAYYDLGQWQQTIDILERGLALKPRDKESQVRLARARAMLERETPGRSEKVTSGNGDGDNATDAPAETNVPSAATTTKPANNDLALTKVYRVGPGDVLEVRLTEDPSAPSSLFTVSDAGLLGHPGFSALLSAAGLTVEELTARIEDDLKQRSGAPKPTVSIAIHEYVSHRILVSGLVKEPGTKILIREAIPLYVVVADAQLLPDAGRVTVLRNESNESFVADLLVPTEMNLMVRPGDVVNVQPNPTQFFYVSGEVKLPGEKSFRQGLTLTQAIIAAGGVTADAKQARLGRDNGKGFLLVSRYKLKDIDSGKVPDPVLRPGDRITIE